MAHTWEAEPMKAQEKRRSQGLVATLGLCVVVVGWVFVWLGLWALAPAVAGWRPVVIASDSMNPSIRAGDVIVARPHSGIGLPVGAVVVFDPGDGQGLVTHRIAATRDDGTYTTGGDANASPDSTPLRPDQVVGVGTLRVPYIGLPMLWVQSGSWSRVMVVLAGLGVVIGLTRTGLSPAPRRDDAARGAAVPDAMAPRPGRRAPNPSASGPVLVVFLVTIGLLTMGDARGAFADTAANTGNSVSAWQIAPDAAVIDVRAPATARTNETVTVEVDVANLGVAEATFEVSLRDVTKGQTIGTDTVTLGPGGATTLAFLWRPGGPQGDRLIEAEARLAGDENPGNDSATTTVVISNN